MNHTHSKLHSYIRKKDEFIMCRRQKHCSSEFWHSCCERIPAILCSHLAAYVVYWNCLTLVIPASPYSKMLCGRLKSGHDHFPSSLPNSLYTKSPYMYTLWELLNTKTHKYEHMRRAVHRPQGSSAKHILRASDIAISEDTCHTVFLFLELKAGVLWYAWAFIIVRQNSCVK
jgi:hypothetical protein